MGVRVRGRETGQGSGRGRGAWPGRVGVPVRGRGAEEERGSRAGLSPPGPGPRAAASLLHPRFHSRPPRRSLHPSPQSARSGSPRLGRALDSSRPGAAAVGTRGVGSSPQVRVRPRGQEGTRAPGRLGRSAASRRPDAGSARGSEGRGDQGTVPRPGVPRVRGRGRSTGDSRAEEGTPTTAAGEGVPGRGEAGAPRAPRQAARGSPKFEA